MTQFHDQFDPWLEREAARLRQHWDSPNLWPRIAGSLEVERARLPRPRARMPYLAFAAALLLVLIPAAVWLWQAKVQDPLLLTEQTLREVRTAETAYRRSIDKLSALARPQLDAPATPLAGAYREKLLLLDGAIAALSAEAARNPYNTNLRRELLALYRDKQDTLESLIHEN